MTSSHCGEGIIEGPEATMPNTSTAGHCVKSNPPLTRPPCTFTNTHTTPPPTHTQHGGETKKEPIVFWTFWISLRKTTQAENVGFFPEFSSSSPSSSGLMALPPSTLPVPQEKTDKLEKKKGGGCHTGAGPHLFCLVCHIFLYFLFNIFDTCRLFFSCV